MLSEKDIDALFADSKTPFSKEEFNAFIRDPGSRARETLERVHYHNHALCNAVVQWKEYRECIGARPSQSILLLLTPGYGGANDARASLNYLADFFSKYPHGALPRWPIISWMSRTSFTLLETLDSFHRTSHLLAARRHLSDFIDLLIYKGEPLLPRDEFAERLHDSKEAFLGECERNAAEISQWIENPVDESDEARDDLPLSQRKDEIRRKAVALMKALYQESKCSWSEAEETVRQALRGEFDAIGLKSAKNNFHRLRYSEFADAAPATREELVAYGMLDPSADS